MIEANVSGFVGSHVGIFSIGNLGSTYFHSEFGLLWSEKLSNTSDIFALNLKYMCIKYFNDCFIV